jgi:hypothetical protein
VKAVDISFSNTDMLRGMIGKTFEKYKCDPFVFSPSVYGIVGFFIGTDIYRLTSLTRNVSRFYTDEDVAVFQIDKATEEGIVTMMDEGQMIDTPVKDTIQSIDLVIDRETISHNGEDRTLISTKGIVFNLAGGNEISFEIRTWFSEFITIQKGYDLIKKFTPTEEFLEEWEDSAGYDASVRREVVTIG